MPFILPQVKRSTYFWSCTVTPCRTEAEILPGFEHFTQLDWIGIRISKSTNGSLMDEALESKRAECHRLKICGGQDFFSDRQRRPSTVRRNYRIKVAGTQAYPTLSILSFFSGAGGRVGPEDIDNPPKPLCTDLIAHVARQILRGCHHFLQGNHITLYSGLILIIFF